MFKIWVVEDEHDVKDTLTEIFGRNNISIDDYKEFVEAYKSLLEKKDRPHIFLFDVRLTKTWPIAPPDPNFRTIANIKNEEKWDSLSPEHAGSFLFAKAIYVYGSINALIFTAHGHNYEILQLLNMARFLGKNLFERTTGDNETAVKNSMDALLRMHKSPPSFLHVDLNGEKKQIKFPEDIPKLKSSLGIYDKTINNAYLENEALCIVSNDPDQASPKIYEAIFDAQKVLLEEGKEVNGEIVANKLVDLINELKSDNNWWDEKIGNNWTMKSFLCKDGKYYKNFLLNNQDRLKKLLKRAQYDLSKITSSGLNLFGINDVTHGVSNTKRYGRPIDIVGDQLQTMIGKIAVWPGSNLPNNYLTNLNALNDHISVCNSTIRRDVERCGTCYACREILRLYPQAIVDMITNINRGECIANFRTNNISIFFPFNHMFKDLLRTFLQTVQQKNNYERYYVTFHTSSSVTSFQGFSLTLWSLLIVIFDNGRPFTNAKGYHSMSDCNCGDIIKRSDYRYCGKFYIGSKFNTGWEWINYLNLKDQIPHNVESIEKSDIINNAYVFEIFVYDH